MREIDFIWRTERAERVEGVEGVEGAEGTEVQNRWGENG